MRTVASLTLASSCLLAATWTTSLTTTTAAAAPQLDRQERAIVRAINRQRGKHSLPKVYASAGLSHAADFHSSEMLDANFFAHESRDGGPFDQRVRRFTSRREVGETLAILSGCGRGTAGRVVRMWMNSDGHRAILLSSQFQSVGVGKRSGDLGAQRACVVTADFASRQ
jgi:uncharacterized protein YkwD